MGRVTSRRMVVRYRFGHPGDPGNPRRPGNPSSPDGGAIASTAGVAHDADRGSHSHRAEDTLVVEEPLEIRVGGSPLTVTMRTPGTMPNADVELAIGFLLSEGIITSGEDVTTGEFCPGATDGGLNTYNVLDITLAPGIRAPAAGLARNFVTSSSCGICGKASIDEVRTLSAYPVEGDPLRITPETASLLPDRLRADQKVFDKTGGLHAAGIYDAATDRLLAVREDVGRHNAVDKVIGWAASNDRLPLTGTALVVSGRASFELVQKASMAGIPALVAVSAPSSLAAELADEVGMTLIGFVRGSSLVVYSGAERVVPGNVVMGAPAANA